MKKSLISILMLLPFVVTAQKSYTITGELSALNVPAKAYLVTLQDRKWKETDSVEIKNGKFQFTGRVNEPQRAIMVVKRNGTPESRQSDRLDFYLENSNITFTAKDS